MDHLMKVNNYMSYSEGRYILGNLIQSYAGDRGMMGTELIR